MAKKLEELTHYVHIGRLGWPTSNKGTALCGVGPVTLTDYIPNKRYMKATIDKNKVTCKNCKRTILFKYT